MFYTILDFIISELTLIESNRSTDIFNNLEYIIIDDPVSSIDDTRIITVALKLIEIIKSNQNNQIKFLITTHHALFFNVIVNSFKNEKKINFEEFSLSKNSQIFKLKELGKSPFSYHLRVKDILQKVINDDAVEKYHFNLFRALLEKTANFLGYDNWYYCVSRENRQALVKLLNHYSHNKLSELE